MIKIFQKFNVNFKSNLKFWKFVSKHNFSINKLIKKLIIRSQNINDWNNLNLNFNQLQIGGHEFP